MRASICKIRSLGKEYFAVEHSTAFQFMLNLRGKAGEAMDTEEALVDAKRRNHKMVSVMVKYYAGMIGYYYENHEQALANLKQVRKQDCLGLYVIPRHFCLLALTHVALALEGKRVRYNMNQAKSIMKMLKKWIDQGNPNIVHLVCLLEAEMAAVKSPETAEMMYQTAIRAVTRSCYRHDKALAYARAARFFFRVKQDDHWFVDKAIEAYADWGATGIVKHLAQKYVVPDKSCIFGQGFKMSESTRNVINDITQS